MTDKIEVVVGSGKNRGIQKTGVEKVYEIYDYLNTDDAEGCDVTVKEAKFKELLLTFSGSDIKEKKLAAPFVAKFIERFPSLEDEALDVLFTLCEDDDILLRKQVEKDLVAICRKLPHLIPPVAYVFAQLLQSTNDGELTTVEEGLRSLIFMDVERSLTGMFEQIRAGSYTVVYRCVKLLHSYSKAFGFNDNAKSCICKEIRGSIHRFTDMEVFMLAMEILGSTGYLKTPSGSNLIVEVIENFLKIDQPLPSKDIKESVAQIIICSDYVFPYFHGKTSSMRLFSYYCTRVLPHLFELEEKTQFNVLQMAVELSLYFDKIDTVQGKLCLEALVEFTSTLLHNPPSDLNDSSVPDYQFSFLEICLYLIHKVGSFILDAFEEITARPMFSDFKEKLEYLLQAVVAYKIRIQKDFRKLDRDEIYAENKKVSSLRVLANISQMGKPLWQKKVCKDKIKISWKDCAIVRKSFETVSEYSSRVVGSGSKRFLYSVNRHSGGSKLYQPPSGKYSSKTEKFDSNWENRRARNNGSSTSLRQQDRFRKDYPYSRRGFSR